jgi:hypothetical protein
MNRTSRQRLSKSVVLTGIQLNDLLIDNADGIGNATQEGLCPDGPILGPVTSSLQRSPNVKTLKVSSSDGCVGEVSPLSW